MNWNQYEWARKYVIFPTLILSFGAHLYLPEQNWLGLFSATVLVIGLLECWRLWNLPIHPPKDGRRILATLAGARPIWLQVGETLILWLILSASLILMILVATEETQNQWVIANIYVFILGSISEGRWLYLRYTGQVEGKIWVIFSPTHLQVVENMVVTYCAYDKVLTLQEKAGTFSHRLIGRDASGNALFKLSLDAFTPQETADLLSELQTRCPNLSATEVESLKNRLAVAS